MKTDELNSKHLTADEGKTLRRISDGWMDGRKRNIPRLHLPDRR